MQVTAERETEREGEKRETKAKAERESRREGGKENFISGVRGHSLFRIVWHAHSSLGITGILLPSSNSKDHQHQGTVQPPFKGT